MGPSHIGANVAGLMDPVGIAGTGKLPVDFFFASSRVEQRMIDRTQRLLKPAL
jgi:hypothetical protein